MNLFLNRPFMKYFILLFILFPYSCTDYTEKKITMIHYQLRNGDAIELEYTIGNEIGATTPDVTWIRKIPKNGDSYLIGKIKAVFEGDNVIISQLNDSIIKIRFIDTVIGKKQFKDYIVNLNKNIKPNDGSPYIE